MAMRQLTQSLIFLMGLLNSLIISAIVLIAILPIGDAPGTKMRRSSELEDSRSLAVLNENENDGCFKRSVVEFVHTGEVLYWCRPGYRRERRGEHRSRSCCVCERGTYQPQPNDCAYCIQKTFCPDYGLEFEDFGSHTDNAVCRNITDSLNSTPSGEETPLNMSTTTVPQTVDQPPGVTDNVTTEVLSNTTDDQHVPFPPFRAGALYKVVILVTASMIGGAFLIVVVGGLIFLCCWKLTCCGRPRQAVVEWFERKHHEQKRSQDGRPYIIVNAAGEDSVNLDM